MFYPYSSLGCFTMAFYARFTTFFMDRFMNCVKKTGCVFCEMHKQLWSWKCISRSFYVVFTRRFMRLLSIVLWTPACLFESEAPIISALAPKTTVCLELGEYSLVRRDLFTFVLFSLDPFDRCIFLVLSTAHK